MSQVIVVASGKGGTGKTTVTVSLALALAKKSKKVLVIDADSGMRGTDLLFGISDSLVYDISDVVSGDCQLNDALIQVEGVYALHSISAPSLAEDEVSPTLLKQFVDSIKDQYDYVIIDSPAGTGSGFEAAATAADRAIVVVNPEPISVRSGQNVRRLLSEYGITDIRLIINRFDKERFKKIGIYQDLDEIIDIVAIQLIGLIPEDVSVVALSQRGAMTIGWSQTKIIFDSIAKRVEGSNVPLVLKV